MIGVKLLLIDGFCIVTIRRFIDEEDIFKCYDEGAWALAGAIGNNFE